MSKFFTAILGLIQGFILIIAAMFGHGALHSLIITSVFTILGLSTIFASLGARKRGVKSLLAIQVGTLLGIPSFFFLLFINIRSHLPASEFSFNKDPFGIFLVCFYAFSVWRFFLWKGALHFFSISNQNEFENLRSRSLKLAFAPLVLIACLIALGKKFGPTSPHCSSASGWSERGSYCLCFGIEYVTQDDLASDGSRSTNCVGIILRKTERPGRF